MNRYDLIAWPSTEKLSVLYPEIVLLKNHLLSMYPAIVFVGQSLIPLIDQG